MKKVGFVMVISAFLLVGCGTKGNKAEESRLLHPVKLKQ